VSDSDKIELHIVYGVVTRWCCRTCWNAI